MTENAVSTQRSQGRTRPPRVRTGATSRFVVGGQKGYLITGEHTDGTVADVTIKFAKQGSTMAGMMDAVSAAINLGLQAGAPLDEYVEGLTRSRFHPAGPTDDEELPEATSLLDYVFQRLALDYIPAQRRAELGILTAAERNARDGGEAWPADLVATAMSAPVTQH